MEHEMLSIAFAVVDVFGAKRYIDVAHWTSCISSMGYK